MTAKAYQIGEADITWLASGGSALLTLTSLAAGAGRQGAQYDHGIITTARSFLYVPYLFMKFATAPVVDEVISYYVKGWTPDGNHAMNDDGTGDAALSAEDKLKNLLFCDSLIVDEASSTPEFASIWKGDPIWLPYRYLSPTVWNDTADAFSSTAGDHGFVLSPVVLQAQAT